MTDLKLPELPEAYALECGARFNEDGTVLMEIFAEPLVGWSPCATKQPLYTAAQLTAYATAAVLAERAAAEADARRYRWLRKRADAVIDWDFMPGLPAGSPCALDMGTSATLDAAIDAAMGGDRD